MVGRGPVPDHVVGVVDHPAQDTAGSVLVKFMTSSYIKLMYGNIFVGVYHVTFVKTGMDSQVYLVCRMRSTNGRNFSDYANMLYPDISFFAFLLLSPKSVELQKLWI